MVQPVMVKQAMVSEVHMDLDMEVAVMTEGMMTEHIPHVMCTATGVQHQLEKQPTPGLALSGIMDVLQHERLGLMIDRRAACHPGSKQHSRCMTEQRSVFCGDCRSRVMKSIDGTDCLFAAGAQMCTHIQLARSAGLQ